MSVRLSSRLQAICDLVPAGSRICDVGCDHALVDIYLLQTGKIRKALAMDVAKGPLDIARQNLALVGLSDDCEVRQSDGLSEYHPGEADTLIIAGMGGILMQRILEDGAVKGQTGSFRQLILSPQSEPWLVREWLFQNQIGITNEILIEEEGKFYPILYCVPGKPATRPAWEKIAAEITAGLTDNPQEYSRLPAASILSDPLFRTQAEAEYGPVLLARKDPVLFSYIVRKLRSDLALMETLKQNKSSEHARHRLLEVEAESGRLQILLLAWKYLEPA